MILTSRPSRTRLLRRGTAAAVVACLAAGGQATVGAAHAGTDPTATTTTTATTTATTTVLHLVTLEGPGTSALGSSLAADAVADRMREHQDEVLDAVDAPEPVYRWTTALNGFAVELDQTQVADLAADPRVALVEANEVRRLAALGTSRPAAASTTTLPVARAGQRGAGVVVGFVDTGIDPESRAFSRVAAPGPGPRDFRGTCEDAPGDDTWDRNDCDTKVVAARHFVAGFGEDRLRTNAALSPADTDGHGTAVASVAAGATRVPIDVSGHRLGRFSGVAPAARVAAYKACWSAPDPEDDGCATADLVAAIDQATADGVDVLNLSVGGPNTIDTVERALLGATEGGALVVAAAGNDGADHYSAHPSPWVLTVGATTGTEPLGRVHTVGTEGGPTLRGPMAAAGTTGPAPLVLGADAAAPGASAAQARVCAPGSLDARRTAGAVVVCERGAVARLEKSAAVRLADGVGMVLTNTGRGSTDADLHAVPTVHLSAREADRLVSWARSASAPRVTLAPAGVDARPARTAGFSSGGDPTARILKPDLVAPGVGVPSAVPGGWDLLTGTSIAAARVAGQAAVLLGRTRATAAEVRSALVTTARPLAGESGLRAGAGRARVARPPVLLVGAPLEDHRAWLTGERSQVNQPHLLLSNGVLRGRRTLTNAGRRPVTVTATLEGFRGPVTVTPAAATIRPGRSLTFTVRARAATRRSDDGAVVWRTPDGRATRIPVVVTR